MRLCPAILLVWFGISGHAAEPSVDFVHISDVHLANIAGVRPELKERLHPGAQGETLRTVLGRFATSLPDFIMLTGDIVDGWCFDGASGHPVYGQIALFKSIQDESKVPLFLALGNHDIQCYRYDSGKPVPDMSVMAKARREWSSTFPCFRGRTYYAFRKQVGETAYRFMVLDDSDAGKDEVYDERLRNAELEWVRQQLAESGSDVIILVMHVPFLERDFFTKLKAVIAGNSRVALAIAGHRHVDSIEEIDLGDRTLVEVLTPALRAGGENWRRIQLFENRIVIDAVGNREKTVRTIPIPRHAY